MIKRLLRGFLEKAGVELALKRNLWYQDAFEVQRKIIGKMDPLIFDVGASEGSVVAKYKTIYPAAVIHAFEPQPDSFQKLEAATSAMKEIYCSNIALSDRQGKETFYKTSGYASSSLLAPVRTGSFIDDHTGLAEKYDVQLETLDNYTRSGNIANIDILKMDTQGNELNILKGGEELLKRGAIGLIYSEIWFAKAYENQPFYEDIALYLRRFGYLPFGLYNIHRDLRLHGQNLWADAIFVKKE
jgi:FkbM family methyltransferase